MLTRIYKNKLFCISLSIVGNLHRLTWVRHSSRKSSTAHSCQYVSYFHVSKQWYGCQCLAFLTCAHMLRHVIAHRGCSDTVRQSALEVDWEKNPLSHQGLEPKSVLCLAFQSDTLPVEPSLPRLCTVSTCVLTCGLMVLFVAGCLWNGGLGLGTVCREL